MLDEILGELFYLYFRACFHRPDFEAMLRADADKLIEWNRGLARGLLWLGGLILLPLSLALLCFFAAYLGGLPTLCGVPVAVGLFLCFIAQVLAPVIGVILLSVLCCLRMEWEPRGFVLAAADVLNVSPVVLQNLWRSLVILPYLVGIYFLICHWLG